MHIKLIHVVLRGFFLFLMALGFFYSSECPDLTSLNHFIMTGVYGSFVIVSLGLILDRGMEMYTDLFIESNFIMFAGLFNVVVSILAFYEYYSGILPVKETMHKGFVSATSMFLCLIDLFFLHVLR